MNEKTITVVSGLPRSGTSMMMMMLEAGGMQVLTDHVREADTDNPRGYYEYEPVKNLESDNTWLPLAQGKAVKIISALLIYLSDSYRYKLIFMRRNMEEILSSQRKMLVRRGKGSEGTSDERMKKVLERHLSEVEEWLSLKSNMDVLYADYNQVIAEPKDQARRIFNFMDRQVDLRMMARAVDERLYRERIDI